MREELLVDELGERLRPATCGEHCAAHHYVDRLSRRRPVLLDLSIGRHDAEAVLARLVDAERDDALRLGHAHVVDALARDSELHAPRPHLPRCRLVVHDVGRQRVEHVADDLGDGAWRRTARQRRPLQRPEAPIARLEPPALIAALLRRAAALLVVTLALALALTLRSQLLE